MSAGERPGRARGAHGARILGAQPDRQKAAAPPPARTIATASIGV